MTGPGERPGAHYRANDVAQLCPGARRSGRQYRAPCPAHKGDNPEALSISDGRDGVLLKCWTHDCSFTDIARALGLAPGDLFWGPRRTGHSKPGANPQDEFDPAAFRAGRAAARRTARYRQRGTRRRR